MANKKKKSDDISSYTILASKYKVLTKEEERALLVRAQAEPKDIKAWDLLIKHNVALVISIAKKYVNQGLSFEDLIQEGLDGLIKGIEKFDLRRNGKLSTYATWWIRQAITRAIDNTSRGVRIPIHKLNEHRIIRRMYREFVERWGTLPNSEELSILVNKAAEADPKKRIKPMTKEEIEFLGRMLHPQVYLDEPHTEDENLTMLDYLPAESLEEPDQQCELSDNKEKLLDLLDDCLTREERLLVMWKFGLLDGKEKDRKELASYRRMSEAEAQRKLDGILAKLRSRARRDSFNLD